MSIYTSSLGLEEITPGSQAGLWGNTTNNNLILIDQAVTGVTPLSFAGASGSTIVLDGAVGTVNTARSAVLNITGSATGANTVVIPNVQKTYLVRNNTGQSVTFQTAAPGDVYAVLSGNSILIFCDGNNNVYTGIVSPSAGTLGVSGGGTGATSFTAGFIKSSGGSSALTSSAAVNMASDVTGTLPVANGGTGQNTLPSGSLLVGNGTGTVAGISPTSYSGYVLTSNGSYWYPALPAAASGVTSIIAGSGISVNQSTGAVTVTNTNTTNTVNPTFSSSVTSPTYYVGNTGNYFSPNPSNSSEIFVTAGSTQATKFASTGIGTYNLIATGSIGCGNLFYGNFNLTVKGTNAGQSAAYVETYSGGSSGIGVNVVGGSTYALVFQYNATSSGAIAVTPGATSYQTTSDRRLKSNITPLTNAGSIIDAMQPREFIWDATGKTARGFIADELQQIIPGAVGGEPNAVDEDGKPIYQGIDASTPEMIALMVCELQSLRKRVAKLEAK